MFKIAKLEKLSNEKVTIDFINYEENNKTTKTLSFNVKGIMNKDEYELSLTLNCKVEELLKIKESSTVNFKDYAPLIEIYFTFNDITYLDLLYDIKICRWLENKFIITITFYSEPDNLESDIYSGIVEFEFNLDDYLEC